MKKIETKINFRTKPSISDDEIRNAMNFESVLKKSKLERAGVFKFKFQLNLNQVLIFTGAVVMMTTYLLLNYSKTDAVQTNPKPGTDTVGVARHEEKILTANLTTKNQPASSSVKEKEIEKQVSTDRSDKNAFLKTTRSAVTTEKASAENIAPSEEIADDEDESKPVIIPAEPLEGFPKFYDYFNRERKYPEDAFRRNIQGEVIARCVITTDGFPTHIEIVKSLTKECDEEVIRLIKNMGLWKPATVNGVPVVYQVELPVTFSISKKDSH